MACDHPTDSGLFYVNAPAKINLCLKILGRRPDHYHNLWSVVGFTDFGDQIAVQKADTDQISLKGGFAADLLAKGGDSLMGAALAGLRQAGFDVPPLHITLEKNIPLGGGLGGGSTNAAALLWLVAEKIFPDMNSQTLQKIAAEIGADVPVCLYPGWQVMTGTGTITQNINWPDQNPVWCVLANPNIEVSTAEIFGQIRTYSKLQSDALTKAVKVQNLKKMIGLGNDLQEAACMLYPEIRKLLSVLSAPDKDLIGCAMTGSGASCFALTRTATYAEKLSRHITQSGYWSVATQMRAEFR